MGVSQSYAPELAELLDLLPSAAFLLQEERISFSNRAAAALLQPPQRLPDVLTPESLSLYRRSGHSSVLQLVAVLDGRQVPAVLRQMENLLVLLTYPAPSAEDLAALTDRVAQLLRQDVSLLNSAVTEAMPLLETAGHPGASALRARITRSVYQLLRLSANLADAEQYGSGQACARLATVDLGAKLNDLLCRVGPLAAAAGVTVDFSCPEPVLLPADWPKVERAVLNLLSNALRCTPAGQTIQVSAGIRRDLAHITVADCGGGMGPEQVAAFAGGRAAGGKGLGLGLLLVRQIAALHGGTVLIDSRPGEGTSVTLTLSCRPQPSEPLTVRSPAPFFDTGANRELMELSDVLPDQAYLHCTLP